MATLKQHAAALDESWKQLRQQWQASSEQWRDQTRQAFARQHWQPLERQVALTQRDLQKLVAVIEQAMVRLREGKS